MGEGKTNRYSFSDVYNAFFDRCAVLRKSRDVTWCVAAIDLESFRLFNDVYGRAAGDRLLGEIWDILRSLEQDTQRPCVAAYLGKDDFALFLEYDRPYLESLLERISRQVSTHGDSVGFRPAMGICRLEPGECADINVYDKAVSALNVVKGSRTRRIWAYDEGDQDRERKEMAVLVRLKEAVAQGKVTFYLQPQCRISTQRIVGAEALARWIEPDGRIIAPSVFIPLLEKWGFIADFDKLVWEGVIRWIRSVLDRRLRPVPISINVSHTDLQTMDVIGFLCGMCEQYRVPASLIKIEITESAYAKEFEKVQHFVREMKARGFLTMMDDFGSGYSSLNMLEHVQVDVLKLDMAFLKAAESQTRRGVTIIESIVNMAKMMNLPIVVEGVETEEQVSFLRNLGCRYAQGYYFYRPMSVEQFEEQMQAEDLLDHSGFSCKRNEQIHVREFLDENTFTDTLLNSVLGAVAFYALEGEDLTITRFNQQFYQAISDARMESRQQAIQNYVVNEDWPALYDALANAEHNVANGGTCEVRFYKSNGGVFWFRMHFYYLRTEGERKIFFGQVEDVSEIRQQTLQFLEVLREQSDVSMTMNLDRCTIQYVNRGNSLSQLGLPSMDLNESIRLTAENRIRNAADRERFKAFFDVNRLREVYGKGIFHESITMPFRMSETVEPVEFNTYYIRYSKDQDLIVYGFSKRKRDS